MPTAGFRFNYTVFYEQMAEDGFLVHVPAMPESVTYGRTRDEARHMAEDAIRCVLASALKTGELVPEDTEPVAERLAVILGIIRQAGLTKEEFIGLWER